MFDSWFDSSLSWKFARSSLVESNPLYQGIKQDLKGQNIVRIEESQGRGRGRKGISSKKAVPMIKDSKEVKDLENDLVSAFPSHLLSSI